MSPRALLLAIALLPALHACGAEEARTDDVGVQVDTIGDTIRVSNPAVGAWGEPRTLVASTSIGSLDGPIEETFGRVGGIVADSDGNVYVLDSQVPTVRRFGADGSYIGSIGREGEGPGEFTAPNGIGVRIDGSLVVRDERSGSLHLFDETGSPADGWRLVSPTFASLGPVWTDDELSSYIVVGLPAAAGSDPGGGPEVAVLRVSENGAVVDTIRSPGGPVVSPELRAEVTMEWGTSVSRSEVPFFPESTYGFAPSGDLVRGLPDGSGIEIVRRSGQTVHVSRAHEPILISPGERRHHRQRVIDGMRRVDENWTWNGPEIPETKPYVNRIYTGIDDHIWVRVHVEGEPDEGDAEAGEASEGERAWSEPVVFDVYRSDGTYLGPVTAPEDFGLFPTPAFDSTGVWSVTRDELGVQRVVRFELRSEGER